MNRAQKPDSHALLSVDPYRGGCRHSLETRMRGTTAAQRIPNRFRDKGKGRGHPEKLKY
jgi:hypothetical protein